MRLIVDKITKKTVKRLMEAMDEDETDYEEYTDDEFKEVFNIDTTAKKIVNIGHIVTIRLNEVGPSNWYLKIRQNKGKVRITRDRKIPWEYP